MEPDICDVCGHIVRIGHLLHFLLSQITLSQLQNIQMPSIYMFNMFNVIFHDESMLIRQQDKLDNFAFFTIYMHNEITLA